MDVRVLANGGHGCAPDPEVASEKALFYLFNTVHSLYLFPSICPARCPVE